ncbi:MAG TPA: hypothetical protein DCR69_09105 [Clostridium sp.]|nr:hypothetical protein [Clostridium sp.]
MNKKLLLFLLLSLSILFVGCSKETAEKPEEKPKTEVEQPKDTNTENNDENKEETPKVPEITDEDIKIIQESVKKYTVGTSLEGLTNDNIKAEFYIGKYTEDNVNLKIYIEKPIAELEEYWNEDVSGVVKRLRDSLVFDTIKTDIKGKLSYNDYPYITVEYTQDGEMYTMQGVKNN